MRLNRFFIANIWKIIWINKAQNHSATHTYIIMWWLTLTRIHANMFAASMVRITHTRNGALAIDWSKIVSNRFSGSPVNTPMVIKRRYCCAQILRPSELTPIHISLSPNCHVARMSSSSMPLTLLRQRDTVEWMTIVQITEIHAPINPRLKILNMRYDITYSETVANDISDNNHRENRMTPRVPPIKPNPFPHKHRISTPRELLSKGSTKSKSRSVVRLRITRHARNSSWKILIV